MTTLTTALERSSAPLSRSGTVTYPVPMGVSPEDSALMLRYRNGDVAAFEILYRRHNDALYRYLLRLTLNRDVAEDLFQDVWGKIIKSRHSYRPTAGFRTFLFRVAHNSFIDHTRRTKKRLLEQEFEPERCPADGDEPDVQAEKTFARQRLEAALRDLPDEQRDAFLLREEAGLSVDQIAKVTGVSRETAKSRLRYAVGKLKIALA